MSGSRFPAPAAPAETSSNRLPAALRHLMPDESYRAGDAPEDRFRDLAIIAWIAHHVYVSSNQILRRYFLATGQSRANGYRVLKRLDDAGVIKREPIPHRRGAAEVDMIRLTGYGYAVLNATWPSWILKPSPDRLDYLLQMAEIALVLQPEGWMLIRQADQVAIRRAISRCLVDQVGPVLGDSYRQSKRATFAMIADLTSIFVSTDLLVHSETKAFRFLLPVMAGTSYRRLIEGIYTLEAYGSLPLEILCYDPVLWQRARRLIPAIVKRETRLEADMHCVLPYHEVHLRGGRRAQQLPLSATHEPVSPLDLPVFG